MTLQELYSQIDGDYDQALRVMRMDRLIDKNIRKLPHNGVAEALLDAGKRMDPAELFETSHAMKGVCANLGLAVLSGMASEIAEEFRPGNLRKLSDSEVILRIEKIEAIYKKTIEGIQKYEEG